MAKFSQKFGDLLREGLWAIRDQEERLIGAIRDEIGYALGLEGGHMVEKWQAGRIPSSHRVKQLARVIVQRGSLGRGWAESFLKSADYLHIDALLDELFSESPTRVESYDCFICFDDGDTAEAHYLAQKLRQAEIKIFVDQWHLKPGSLWDPSIEDLLDRCHVCIILVGTHKGGPWQHEQMQWEIEQRHDSGDLRIVPILLPGASRGNRGTFPAFLTTASWIEFQSTLDDERAFHHLKASIDGIQLLPVEKPLVYEGLCPYRGLQVFDEEHADFFFGREAAVEWLLNAIQSSRFLAVIGPSGSGKSSLVRAGLVPALRHEQHKWDSDRSIHLLKPGYRPLENLAVALTQVARADASVTPLKELIDLLEVEQQSLHLSVRQRLSGMPNHDVIFVVDQFEEIFTLCADEGQRQAFIDNLLYAATVAEGCTYVVITMRADFYGKCAQYPRLATLVSEQQMLVSRMTREELTQAIMQPARLAGSTVEAGLVQLLLRDAHREPNALPLLQHTLLELWEKRSDEGLTLASYQEIGGIERAIVGRAEAEYQHLTAQQQDAAHNILLRLIQPGVGTEDTRRRVLFTEVIPENEQKAIFESVIELFVNARLLTSGRDAILNEKFIEVAHESLIRQWKRLQDWIDDEREDLHFLRRVGEAVQEWDENGRNVSYLYQGIRLVKLKDTYSNKLSKREQDFLESSIRYESERIRSSQRNTVYLKTLAGMGGGSAGGIISAILTGQSEDIGAIAGLTVMGALFGVIITMSISLGRISRPYQRATSLISGTIMGVLLGMVMYSISQEEFGVWLYSIAGGVYGLVVSISTTAIYRWRVLFLVSIIISLLILILRLTGVINNSTAEIFLIYTIISIGIAAGTNLAQTEIKNLYSYILKEIKYGKA